MANRYPIIAQVTSSRSAGSAASVTTSAITTTNGSSFVVMVTCDGDRIGSSPTVISDSKGNTYSTACAGPGTNHGAAIFYVLGGTGGASHTFTFTPTSSDFITIVVVELINVATLGNTTQQQTTGTSHTSGNITTGSESILIGVGALSNQAEGGGSLTNAGIWLGLPSASANASQEGMITGFRFAGSGVTDAFAFTVSSSTNESACIAEFRGTAESGGGSSVPFVGMAA